MRKILRDPTRSQGMLRERAFVIDEKRLDEFWVIDRIFGIWSPKMGQ
jgi:hypothetical protein